MGAWASATVAPSASSCTDFKWTVTEQTSTTAKGSFSATCRNNLTVAGTAEASLERSTITWSAAGNATSDRDFPRLPHHADRHRRARYGLDSRAVLRQHLSR